MDGTNETREAGRTTAGPDPIRARARLDALLGLALSPGSVDERGLVQKTVDAAAELTRSEIGYLHFVSPDQESIQLYAWSTATLAVCTAVEDSHYPVSKAGVWADCVRTARPVVHQSYPGAARSSALPVGHVPVRRHLGVPVVEEGAVRMVIGVGNSAAPYGDDDIATLQILGAAVYSLIARRRHAADAERQQRLFQSVFDSAPVGLAHLDLGARVTAANAQLAELLGATPAEIVADGDLWRLLGAARGAAEQAYRAVASGRSARETLEAELEPTRGGRVPVRIGFAAVRGPEGIEGVAATVEDLSFERAQAAALAAGAEARALRERQLSELVEGISTRSGEGFYRALTDRLAAVLDVDVALVGAMDGSGDRVRSLALRQDGRDRPELVYALAGTPCEDVMESRACCVIRDGLQASYPLDHVAAELGAQSYAGTPLISSAGLPLGILVVASRRPIADVEWVERVLRAFAGRAAAEVERTLAEGRASRALLQTIDALARTVEKRDPYTAGHQRRVAILAVALAEALGSPARSVEAIRIGGLVHDIGKIYVPAEILNRPGRLSDAEFALIRTHAEVGWEILKDVQFDGPVAEMILQHHERLDGSGYPHGLSDDAIIPEARVLTVADVVEAITAHRPYRPSLGFEAAAVELERGRGLVYDEDVVDACLRLFRVDGFDWRRTQSLGL